MLRPIVFQSHSSNFKVTRLKNSSILTPIGRLRTVTPVWIHPWLWNDAQSLTQYGRGALLFFKIIHHISRSHVQAEKMIWIQFEQDYKVDRSYQIPQICLVSLYKINDHFVKTRIVVSNSGYFISMWIVFSSTFNDRPYAQTKWKPGWKQAIHAKCLPVFADLCPENDPFWIHTSHFRESGYEPVRFGRE